MIDCFSVQYVIVDPEQRMPKPIPRMTMSDWAAIILSLIISVLTAYLAYGCHDRKPSKFHHVLIVAFAFFFPLLYLLYYFMRFIVFGEKCGV